MKNLVLLLMSTLLFACAPKSDSNNNDVVATTGVYAYEYPGQGCTTGYQRPLTPEALCESLRNDAVNHYCASDSRYQQFQVRCPGHAWNRGGDNNRHPHRPLQPHPGR